VGKVDFPEVTHADPEDKEALKRGLLPWNTVRDALRDLPATAPAKETLGGGPVAQYPRVKLSDYARLMRSAERFPFNHLTRSYSQRIIDIVQQMKPGETWDSASERMQERYERVIEKRLNDGKKKLERRSVKAQLVKEGLINPVFYRRYYWSAYTRLAWDRPALTITANCNFLGSGRFTHPEEDRGITMREAARLQSFEDDFSFITSDKRDDTETIGVGMDMIGEAVPPLLGEAFARRVAEALNEPLEWETARLRRCSA
jgi:DNA (cytosine-5)-methyltransferase 1